MSMLVDAIRKAMLGYCQDERPGFLNWIANLLISHITGFNYNKYWKRRAYVINPEKRNLAKKLFYFYYIKRTDAKHLSSFGTFLNNGALFSTPPQAVREP